MPSYLLFLLSVAEAFLNPAIPSFGRPLSRLFYAEDPELASLYQTVAQNDPEWFQEFVVDILGEESPEILQLLETPLPKDPLVSETELEEAMEQKATVSRDVASDQESKESKENKDESVMEMEKNLESNTVQVKAASEDSVPLDETVSPKATNDPTKETQRKGDESRQPAFNNESAIPVVQVDEDDASASKAPLKMPTLETKEGPTRENETAAKVEPVKELSTVQPEVPSTIAESTFAVIATASLLDDSRRNVNKSTVTDETVVADTALGALEETEASLQSSRSFFEKERGQNASSQDDERVILFQLDNVTKHVPLNRLTSLGYSLDEVQSLQVEVLDLIVTNKVVRSKYTSKLPERWTVESTDLDNPIEIVSAEEAEARGTSIQPSSGTSSVETHPDTLDNRASLDPSEMVPEREVDASKELKVKAPPAAATSPRSVGQRKESRVRKEQKDATRSRPPTRSSLKGQSSERLAGVDQAPRSKRSKSRRNRNDKPIYNVRGPLRRRDVSSIRRRGDPPPPKIWPDMNTFRRLLRDEASFRLSILGDGWSRTLKEEADWRLDLYRNWLWTIHNGIGEPFIQSRSERTRRNRTIKPSSSKQPRRKKRSRESR